MLPATGAVDAIIGWHVFHYWYPNKTKIIWLKPEQIPRISYIPIAILKYSKNIEKAREFIEFATSSFAKKVFKKYHYFATEEEARRYAPYAEIHKLSSK